MREFWEFISWPIFVVKLLVETVWMAVEPSAFDTSEESIEHAKFLASRLIVSVAIGVGVVAILSLYLPHRQWLVAIAAYLIGMLATDSVLNGRLGGTRWSIPVANIALGAFVLATVIQIVTQIIKWLF